MCYQYISIITATYNAEGCIETLAKNLESQTYKNFEWVVQDGASRDKTVALINGYASKNIHLSLSSTEDSGIYNAWNKAILRARGEWILFLGADDCFAEPTTLHKIAEFLSTLPSSVRFVVCGLDQLNSDGSIVRHYTPKSDGVKELLATEMPLPHPALFHHKSVFKETKFDETFKIAGDYDFICRTWNNDNEAVSFEITATHMATGGISSCLESQWVLFWEILRVNSKMSTSKLGFLTAERCLRFLKVSTIYVLLKLMDAPKALRLLDWQRRLRGQEPHWEQAYFADSHRRK